jgi:hypothetical protein
MQIKQRQRTWLKRKAFKPTYQKERIALTGIDANSGNVGGIGPDGEAVKRSIREVQPAPEYSTAVRDPPTRELRDNVFEYLNMPRTIQAIRKHILADGVQIIKDNRLQTVRRFMELWGFKLAEGNWQRGDAATSTG